MSTEVSTDFSGGKFESYRHCAESAVQQCHVSIKL